MRADKAYANNMRILLQLGKVRTWQELRAMTDVEVLELAQQVQAGEAPA